MEISKERIKSPSEIDDEYHGGQEKILKKDLDLHEQKCGEMKIECKRCSLIYKQNEKHEQLDCIMHTLDRSNKKIESLEKTVENLQLNLHKLEAIVILHSSPGFASGVVHDVPLSSLPSSWRIVYDFPYNHVTTVEELRALKAQCTGHIIVGAMHRSSSTVLKIAALGPSDVLLLNSPRNQSTKHGNVQWYLTPEYSFGFAPSTAFTNCNLADSDEDDNSENRLSWHLSGNGGYRAGAVINLDGNGEWRKIILTKKH